MHMYVQSLDVHTYMYVSGWIHIYKSRRRNQAVALHYGDSLIFARGPKRSIDNYLALSCDAPFTPPPQS